MKNIYLLFAAFLCTFTASSQDFTIGTGTSLNSTTGYPCALQDYYKGSRQQFLYRASDLQAAGMVPGNITAVKFNVVSAGGSMDALTIKIMATSLTALPSSSSWQSGATQVWGATNYQPTTGWNVFTFSTPFTWNGTSGIILEICNGGSGSYTSNSRSAYTVISGTRVSRTYRSDILGNMCGYTGTASSLSSTTETYRPNATFTVVPSSNCSGTPTAGTITTTGGTTFCGSGNPTFSLSGYTTANGVSRQWQYSTNGGSSWSNYTGGTLTTLNPGNITTTTMVRCSTWCSFSGGSSIAGPVTITINPDPTVSVSPSPGYICGSGSVSLTATGTGTSYSWSPSTGLSTTTGSTVTASPTSSTMYSVTATLGGCTTTVAAPVNVAPALTGLTTTATPSAVCSGESTQLAGPSGGSTYSWYYIAPTFHSLSSPQTPSFTSMDDGYATVALPFQFNFFGNDYSTIYIGTNGYAGFTNTSMNSLSSQNLPSTSNPSNLIALFWHDINLNNGGSVTYSTEGVTPNRRFVIYYNNVKDYSNSASSNNEGQIILYETSNVIDVLVGETRNTSTTYSRTLGIENSGGTSAVTPTNRNQGTWQVQASAPEGYRFARPSFDYTWTPNTNLNNDSIPNPIASNNTTATTFTVNVTDVVTSCTAIDSVSITVNPLPSVTMDVPDALCDGDMAILTFMGTADADVFFREDINPQSVTLDGGGDGSYTSGPLSATTVYYLDSAVSTQGCKTTYTSTDTAIVNIRPTASIAGSTTICDGVTAFLMVNVGQGAPPWTVTYSDGTNTFIETSSFTSFAIPVSPSATTTYTLAGMVDSLCTSIPADLTGSATITVNPRPTATLSVPATTICDGTVQDLTIALTGTPPFNFDVFDGTSYTTYSNIMTNTYTISTNLSNTTTYSVTALTDSNCVAYLQDMGTPLTVTVNPRPTAHIQNNDVLCNGASTNLLVTLTGAAPWNFNYFDGNSTVAVNGVVTSPYTLTITPNTTANYTIVSVTDANNCSAFGNDMTGSSNVVVNYNPVIISQSGNVNTCAGDNAVFAVNVTGTNLVFQWTENGVPIVDGGVYSGATTSTLQISDITGLGGNIYQLEIAGICPPQISSSPITLTENTQNNWIGVVDTKWSTPGNWSCGILPTAATDVDITPSAPFLPEVDIPTAICRRLLIYPGSSVVMTGTGNALEVKTDVINLGQFDPHLGKLILSGTVTQNAPGAVYKELEILGGSVKTFLGNIVVTGNLNLYSGYIQLDQNNLTIGETAMVNGGGPSSFVVTNNIGTVIGENMGAGANTGIVLFPVGSSTTSYTPVMISNSGMADDIKVRVIDGVWQDYNGETPIGSPETNNAVNKTWFISETIPGGSNATINPQWNVGDELGGFNNNMCAVSHYVGEDWVPGPLSNANGFNPYDQTLTGVTSFSPFGVSSSGSPLGLDLLSFNGQLVREDVKLTWVTTNEKDMSKYEVERSVDNGRTYDKIGSKAAMNTVGNHTYMHTDAGATNLGADKLLYRLKMTEQGGKYSYSDIVAVRLGKEVATTIELYPNPVTGSELFIRMGDNKSEELTVNITDMSGKVIATQHYAAGSYNAAAMKVDVSQLAQGIYLVRIVDKNNSTIEVLKFNRQ